MKNPLQLVALLVSETRRTTILTLKELFQERDSWKKDDETSSNLWFPLGEFNIQGKDERNIAENEFRKLLF